LDNLVNEIFPGFIFLALYDSPLILVQGSALGFILVITGKVFEIEGRYLIQ
jgi:hypothetical protein